MPDASEVIVPGDQATPEFLSSLKNNPELRKLTIWGGALRNENLEALRDLTGLNELCLGEMRIDDGVFGYLQGLSSLRTLNLAYTDVRGDFTPLHGLPLSEIRLEGCRLVNDRCAASLAGIPSLRHLEIHMTGLTDAGLMLLAQLPLETLWLGPRISDAGLQAVGRISTLKHLDLCAHMVTDEGVAALAGLKNLEILWLSRCSVTDECIPNLSEFRSLRELNINYTGVSSAGLARLRAALPTTRFPEPD